MTKEKKMKNYVLLILLFAAAICVTLYLCNWYKVYDDYQKQTPIIRGTLLEIKSEELEHYIMENPTFTIYMCTSGDDVCRKYEKKFIKLCKNMNLQEYIVYLNLSDIDQENFVNSFNNKYNYKVNLTTSYPAFVTFEDGKVKYILQGKENEPLTISKTKQYLELNNIGE